MLHIWLYTLGSVGVVSLMSLLGVFTLGVSERRIRGWLFNLVSFSAGALLGDVFLHIFPEFHNQGFTTTTGCYILFGILVFFVLERFILWHHSHTSHDEHVHSVVYLSLLGDALHNFIDGIVIAASFLVDVHLGFASALAVLFHEIPHEIGQYAILIHGGWDKYKALAYNFLSGVASIAGALLVLSFNKPLHASSSFLLAFSASSFIYIAMSDLIPELHKEAGIKKSLLQFGWLLLGIGILALLLRLE